MENTNTDPRDVLAGHIQDKPHAEQDKILAAYDKLDDRAQRASVGIMHLIKTGSFLETVPNETD